MPVGYEALWLEPGDVAYTATGVAVVMVAVTVCAAAALDRADKTSNVQRVFMSGAPGRRMYPRPETR
jgi:hypothetical protein